MGTFARWKGHVTFLEALARVPRHVPIRGYVIGDAVYDTEGSQHSRSELRDVVERLGLGDRVGFTGFVARPEAVLRALDVVVHASTSPEPFGLVIAEAMACERAVIVSLAGGAAEIVTVGVDALGHQPADPQDLAARITELAIDPALRRRIGRAARTTAERCFDPARLARELVPIYQSVVDEGAFDDDRGRPVSEPGLMT
jgi:glycosyltransferase involved in cell wall biosynthesis